MRRILPRNTRVILTSDPTQDKKDRYDRSLRYIIKKNGGHNVKRRQVLQRRRSRVRLRQGAV